MNASTAKALSSLTVDYPARRNPAGTVEIGVTINGHDYYTYMIPGSCVLRSFNGLNNITNKGAAPYEILAAILLSGIGGTVMVFTDAYAGGSDLQKLKAYIESQPILVEGGVQLTCTPTGGSGYAGKNFGGLLVMNPAALKKWYDSTFGAAEAHGFANWMRVNMDSLFYQVGGRPHEARSSDELAHQQLNASLAESRRKLIAAKPPIANAASTKTAAMPTTLGNLD